MSPRSRARITASPRDPHRTCGSGAHMVFSVLGEPNNAATSSRCGVGAGSSRRIVALVCQRLDQSLLVGTHRLGALFVGQPGGIDRPGVGAVPAEAACLPHQRARIAADGFIGCGQPVEIAGGSGRWRVPDGSGRGEQGRGELHAASAARPSSTAAAAARSAPAQPRARQRGGRRPRPEHGHEVRVADVWPTADCASSTSESARARSPRSGPAAPGSPRSRCRRGGYRHLRPTGPQRAVPGGVSVAQPHR